MLEIKNEDIPVLLFPLKARTLNLTFNLNKLKISFIKGSFMSSLVETWHSNYKVEDFKMLTMYFH